MSFLLTPPINQYTLRYVNKFSLLDTEIYQLVNTQVLSTEPSR